MTSIRSRRFLPVLLGLAALVAALIPSQRTSAHTVAASAHPCAVTTASGDNAFVRNFNPFGAYRDFTLGGVYEPLYVMTIAGGGHSYPWLATNYQWTDGNKTLLITVRQGVQWSDGQPFTANDVLFTFTAGKINAAMDQIGLLGASSNIASVNLAGMDQVAVHFKKVDTTDLVNILSYVKIIPQHIWATVKNPTTWTNPNPVGTGPFTQVQSFSAQDYILTKNPYYWQPGKPMIPCVERVGASGNDAASLMLIHGDVDWTGNFIANAQKVYVSRDPAHFHYYYANYATAIGIFYNNNTATYPWSIVDFRKALSMAINRQQVYQIGEYGYEPPSDATGIAHAYPTWVNHSLDAQATALTTYNPSAAKALLAKSGFTWVNGQLYDPKGKKVSIALNVISGWTDWVTSMQVIEQDLKAIGVDASVALSADYNSWSAEADKGLVPHLHWTNTGPTPYNFFYGLMAKGAYLPAGQAASNTGNWDHWYSPAATALLQQFRSTSDVATQHAIVDKLQQIELQNFPFIPIMISANWYTYSTKYFTGWPTQKDFYGFGAVYVYPDNVVELTRIKPVTQ